jgi:hypothetical protein
LEKTVTMTLDDYRAQARARWGRATPFHTGYMAGLAADMTLRTPRKWQDESARLFEQGRSAGLEQRARDEQQHAGEDDVL